MHRSDKTQPQAWEEQRYHLSIPTFTTCVTRGRACCSLAAFGVVQALKQFGKELPDRWERIAGVVPGKGKAACFKRFKELRDVFRSKKDGA